MSEFLNFIIALVIIIFAAKASGYISSRLGQPAVLGELLAGIILGPSLFDIFHAFPSFNGDHQLLETIRLMAEVGVLLLMFLAGLELDFSDLLKFGRVSALSGTLGVIAPLTLGWGVARLFGADNIAAIYIGLALSATSVSISAQTLMELDMLRSRVGLALLGAAVFDDILVILLLSIASLLAGRSADGLEGILITVARMAGYFILALALGIGLLPRLTTRIHRLPIPQGTVAFVLCVILIYAWAAEVIGGVAAITGAFLAGLFLSRLPFKTTLAENFSPIAYGIFVPVFFVNIGLRANLQEISTAWMFAIVLTIVAILSKILGCGLGGILSGLGRLDSLRLGVGMVSRGEVGLIVAAFALEQLLISPENFSVVVFMVIVATLLTPVMLRAIYANRFATQTQPVAIHPAGRRR